MSFVYYRHDGKTAVLRTVFNTLQYNVMLPGNDRKSDAPDAIAFLKAARNGILDDIEAVLDNQEFDLETISTDGVSFCIFPLIRCRSIGFLVDIHVCLASQATFDELIRSTVNKINVKSHVVCIAHSTLIFSLLKLCLL
jgi:hypothetical protein